MRHKRDMGRTIETLPVRLSQDNADATTRSVPRKEKHPQTNSQDRNQLLQRCRLLIIAASLTLVNLQFSVQSADADTAAPNAAASANAGKPPIEGKVEQEDSLPAIEDQFKPGSKFDENKFASLTPDNVWIPTPDWFAGKWHSDTQTLTYLYDYQQGIAMPEPRVMKAVGDVTYGMQKAKDGQVWHFAKVPKLEKQEIEVGTANLYAVREELISYGPTQLVLKFFYYEIKTNRKGTILSVDRVSSINTYSPLDDGLVRIVASMKSFDENGQPKLLQHTDKALRRTSSYQEIDEQDGLNLKQLFAEFLKKSGKEDQIP